MYCILQPFTVKHEYLAIEQNKVDLRNQKDAFDEKVSSEY